jgi:hypothetical protein
MTSLVTAILTVVGMIVLTTFPVLVPVIITAGHAIRRRTMRRRVVPAAA